MLFRPVRHLLVFAGAVLFSMAAFFIYEIITGYRQELEQAERDTARLARALEEHTSVALSAVDGTLQSLTDRLSPPADLIAAPAALHGLLHREAQRLPQVRTIVVLDASGWVIADSQHSVAPRINLADREYFHRHQTTPSDELVISEPQNSRISNEPFFGMSRKFRHVDGSLAGVIAAFVEPRHFEIFYKSLNLGTHGVISLLRNDGMLLVREPSRPNEPLVSYATSPLFTDYLRHSPVGTYRSVYRDGLSRITSYRVMTSMPLLVSIAVATDDALADWYAFLREYVVIWLLFAAGVIAVTLILVITASRHAQLEARSREIQRQFQAVAENSPGIVYRRQMTPDGKITYPLLSAGVKDVLGVSASEARENPALVLHSIHPDDREMYRRSLDESAKTQSTWSLDFRVLARDGTTRWIRGRSQPHRTTDGSTIWDGTATDITSQKSAEERVVKAEQRLRDAISSLSDGFILWDENDRLVMYNEATIRHDPSHALALVPGQTFEQIMTRRANSGAILNAVGREQEYIARRLDQHRNPTGAPIEQRFRGDRWIRLTEHRTREGGVVSLRHDITLEKRLIDELLHAKETAEHANLVKAEFLANMSHELRTPLNAVIGFSDLMAQQIFGPLGNQRYLECSKDIQESGQHLLALINDVLDYAKVEAGHMALDEEDVDVSTIIEACRRMVVERAQRARVKLSTAVEVDRIQVRVDQRKLKQILINLITNAIKYSKPGGTVSVTARMQDESLALIVADTGMGIPADSLATVMEPFRQVDNAYNRTHEGTGLGLPLTKRLVEMHGGRISLESALGVGTTVTVILPPDRVLEHVAA